MNCARIPLPYSTKVDFSEKQNPPLADAIWAVARGHETLVLCEDEFRSTIYVLDGESLLRRQP